MCRRPKCSGPQVYAGQATSGDLIASLRDEDRPDIAVVSLGPVLVGQVLVGLRRVGAHPQRRFSRAIRTTHLWVPEVLHASWGLLIFVEEALMRMAEF
jgi:hypothetical protein